MFGRFFRQIISFVLMPALIIGAVIPPAAAISYRLTPRNFNEMYAAAARGDIRLLLEAVHRGMNINATNAHGDTGLCVAAKRRNATAYNAFRQAGANPNHPCTWEIPYYHSFVESDAVQAGATWKSADYVPPVYSMEKSSSRKWALGGLLVATGVGTALLLGGGGGGGGGDDAETSGEGGEGGGETPGLSCEYGCAEYNTEGQCIVCNEPPVEICEENPCAEGCFTDEVCADGFICTERNSCGGCERCEESPVTDICAENPCADGCYENQICDKGYVCTERNSCGGCTQCEQQQEECITNPCADGCYINITCGSNEICSRYNQCGGCEVCVAKTTLATNFAIETDKSYENAETLVNTGSDKTGAWGGIYTSFGDLNNQGDIVLGDGTGGVGIMATDKADIDQALSSEIKTGLNNITNSGSIMVTANSSYGILAETLGNVSDNVLSDLNTLKNEANIHLEGADNTGILLRGNGIFHNSGDISLTGKITDVFTNVSIDWAHNYSYIEPQIKNVGIFLTLDGRAAEDSNRGYNITKEITNTWVNEGNISVKLVSDKVLELPSSGDHTDNYQTVAGMNVSVRPLNALDKTNVKNLGNITVDFSVNPYLTGNQEDYDSDEMYWAARYRATGLSVLNQGSNVSITNEDSLINAQNSGKISVSGNGILQGIVVDGVHLTNEGDIAIELRNQNHIGASSGLVAQHSIIDQYANIESTFTESDNKNFYSVSLYDSILNTQTGATLNGNIEAADSTINNSGTMTGSSAEISYSTLNNLAGGIFNFNYLYAYEVINSGELTANYYSADDMNYLAQGVGTFVNESSGVANIQSLGGAEGGKDEKDWQQYLESVINRGTLKTNIIRTKDFENSGRIETKYLHYYSYNDNGTIDLRNIDFEQINGIVNNTGGDASVLQLNSRYQDSFIVGDISNVIQPQVTENWAGGNMLHYTDWSNEDASPDKRSSLSVDNIKMFMYKVFENQTDRVNGIVIDRDYVDTILNGTMNIVYEPRGIAGVQLNGESNSFTNNGKMLLKGAHNMSGIEGNTAGSIIINKGAIEIENIQSELRQDIDYYTYGITATDSIIQTYANSSISLKSNFSGNKTYGIKLSGSSSGYNEGAINISSIDNGVGIYAESTSDDGFENKGIIDVQADNAINMFADGYNAATGGDRYVKLTNSGTLNVASSNGVGMLGDGSLSEIINNGDIKVSALQGAGMQGKHNATLTNNGTILINNTESIGIYADSGTVINSKKGKIEDSDAGLAKRIGIYLEGTASGYNEGKIMLIGGEQYGVYATSTGETGFENKGEIVLSGGINNIGMYADGYVDGTNDQYVKLINSGKISVTGSNGIGMYANGSKSIIINQGEITINGTDGKEMETANGGVISNDDENSGTETQAFRFANGAKFYNLGVLESEDDLNLDALADEKSKIIAGRSSIIKTGSVSGTLYGGADLTTGSNDDYYESRVIEAEENNVSAASNSAMFAAEMLGDKIAMTRYNFNELMIDKNLASYLENNYQQGNRVDMFDAFKTAESTTTLNNMIAETLGTNFVPAFAYQNFARLRHINRTMADLMQNNVSEKDERVSVVSDNYYHDIKAHDGVSGYEERLFGFSGLFDKKINNNFRYGIGLGIYRADADFDNNVNRDDNLFEIYNPYWFDYERWGALVMPYVGFSDGDYERYDGAKKHTTDLKAYYYGLNNRIYLKAQAIGINIEPTAEINLNGVYQDDFSEDGGISLKAKNMFSAETGLGAYVSKAADFGAKGRLNLKAGAMYYYELNDDAYQNINARFAGMNGLYKIKGYDNSRSRGIVSLKADYQLKGWNLYAEIVRLLEHNDNMIYNAGLKYSF